jgi:hypothetical protein
MAVFARLVNGLKRAERELQAQLTGVRAAISSLASGAPAGRKRGRRGRSRSRTQSAAAVVTTVRKKRKPMSAEARAKIAAAQRARWAKHNAAKKR